MTDLTPEMLDELERLREQMRLAARVADDSGKADAETEAFNLAARRYEHAALDLLPALLAAARKKAVYEKALRQIADNSYCGMREDVCDCGAHAHDIAREALSGEGGTT